VHRTRRLHGQDSAATRVSHPATGSGPRGRLAGGSVQGRGRAAAAFYTARVAITSKRIGPSCQGAGVGTASRSGRGGRGRGRSGRGSRCGRPRSRAWRGCCAWRRVRSGGMALVDGRTWSRRRTRGRSRRRARGRGRTWRRCRRGLWCRGGGRRATASGGGSLVLALGQGDGHGQTGNPNEDLAQQAFHENSLSKAQRDVRNGCGLADADHFHAGPGLRRHSLSAGENERAEEFFHGQDDQ
jgi:hypothetical protein